MNYLREVLAFNEYAELQGLDPQEFRLWHALMSCNNRFHWAESFTMPMILLQGKTGLSQKAVYRARGKLIKRGLITVKNNGGNKAAAYHMVSLYTPLTGEKTSLREDENGMAEAIEAQSESLTDSLSGMAADSAADSVSDNLPDSVTDKLSHSLSHNLSDNLSNTAGDRAGDRAGGKRSVLYKQKEETQTKQKKEHIGAQAPKRARLQFNPPTMDEVSAYCRERGSSVNPSQWLSYYEANGWKVGKNPMKDWQAAIRTWENNGIARGKAAAPTAARVYEDTDGRWL